MKNPNYTNKNLAHSVKCAFAGLCAAFRCEKNFFTYIIIAAVFLALNILSGSGKFDYAVYVICTAAVFAAELVNTAAERICDSLTHEDNTDIEFVKDVCAGAVLVCGIGFFVCEGIVLVCNFTG